MHHPCQPKSLSLSSKTQYYQVLEKLVKSVNQTLIAKLVKPILKPNFQFACQQLLGYFKIKISNSRSDATKYHCGKLQKLTRIELHKFHPST